MTLRRAVCSVELGRGYVHAGVFGHMVRSSFLNIYVAADLVVQDHLPESDGGRTAKSSARR